MRIEKNFSLRPYNTFDVDVKCKYFVESEKEAEFIDFIREVLEICIKRSLHTILFVIFHGNLCIFCHYHMGKAHYDL